MTSPMAQQIENLPAMQEIRDVASISGSGRYPGGVNENPLQYSCLGNRMDGGDWWATVQRVTKSWTRLSIT